MSSCLPSRRPRYFVILFLSLILTPYFLLPPRSVLAITIYNRYLRYPEQNGLEVEKDNTDFLDAAHPCSRTRGRSFTFSHKDSFKLGGLSLYVYLLGLESHRFEANLFRLSLLNPYSSSPLASEILPTYAKIIERDRGLNTTFEVFFPLDQNISGGVTYTAILKCFTDDVETFRVAESSRVTDGLITGYYNSETSTVSPSYYMEGRKILFTSFSPQGAPHFPAVDVSLAPSPSTLAPKYHPVIFVHGLGGDPENFESDSENRNYVKLLTDLGYPRDYIHLYSYGYKYDPLKRVNHYNYQGDVKEIADGMEVVVNSLSDKHKGQGGDGRVDIVAHSLGNLVTRQYLLNHKDNHKIRRYIAVGAPFKGAWPMGVDRNIGSLPLVGKSIEKAVANLFIKKLNEDRPGNRPLDKSSMAYAQVTPGSDFLDGSNGINKTPITGIQFFAIYGNLQATLNQKIFNKTFQRKIDIGDGLILADSATYSGWTDNAKKFAYNDGTSLDLKFDRAQGVLAADFVMSDMKSIKTLHGDLLTRKDSQDKIVCIISKENLDGC